MHSPQNAHAARHSRVAVLPARVCSRHRPAVARLPPCLRSPHRRLLQHSPRLPPPERTELRKPTQELSIPGLASPGVPAVAPHLGFTDFRLPPVKASNVLKSLALTCGHEHTGMGDSFIRFSRSVWASMTSSCAAAKISWAFPTFFSAFSPVSTAL